MTQEYTLNQFQEQCATTAIYGEKIYEFLKPIRDGLHKGAFIDIDAINRLDEVEKLLNVSYAVLGLAGEAGEVANKMKKVIRDGTTFEPLNKEVQGTNWYVQACLTELGVSANDAAVQLAETLQSRKERGVIQGNGDNR
jgi:hypothetical protein